jgi:hypothetical protein
MVVMTLTDADGKVKFWIRSLSSDTAQPMPETDSAVYPFWSPDSQSVAFFAADGSGEAAYTGKRSSRLSLAQFLARRQACAGDVQRRLGRNFRCHHSDWVGSTRAAQ